MDTTAAAISDDNHFENWPTMKNDTGVIRILSMRKYAKLLWKSLSSFSPPVLPMADGSYIRLAIVEVKALAKMHWKINLWKNEALALQKT